MINNQSNSNFQNPKPKFDLEERTAKFAEGIISFCRKIPQDIISRPIINQLIRSGTSIGANYFEANEANSKKDFINKIAIAKKETKETRYWLRMIVHTFPEFNDTAKNLSKEAQELNLIFASIIRNSKK